MIEKLFPINLPPGLYKNGTRYQAKGRWYDANLVRFVSGTIRPVGCWRRMKDTTDTDIVAVSGKPRGTIAYRGNNSVIRIGIGTHTNAYALVDGTLTDITPAGFTTGLQDGGYGSVPAVITRRAIITWAELEVPSVSVRRAVITWAELEIPGGGNYGAGNYGAGIYNG